MLQWLLKVIRLNIIILVFSVFLVFSWLSPSTANVAGKQFNVLIISSYHIGFGGTDPMVTGIMTAFSRSDLQVNFYIEYLDSKRHKPNIIFPAIEQLYRTKFTQTTFDVIIVADNNAFDFIRQQRDELFPDSPVVFCGINNYNAAMIQGFANITGVAEDISLTETVELALSLHPDTTHLAVLSDSTTTGKANLQKFKEIESSLPKDLKVVTLANLTAAELSEKLEILPEKTVLLQLSFYMDRSGRRFSQKEQMAFILKHCDIPIYSAWDFFIAHGVLGGVVTYFPLQGEIAGDLSVQLLKGTPIEKLPVVTSSPNVPLFDYRILEKFSISLSSLPEESIVLNIPQTFYSQNKVLIWVVIVFVIFQSMVITSLIIAINRKRQAQRLLLESEEKYRQLYQQAPVMLHKTDMQGRFTEVNEQWLATFGYSRNEVIGMKSVDLLAEESKQQADKLLEQLFATGSLKDLSLQFIAKNGAVVDTLITIYTEMDSLGQKMGTRAAITDVTESNKMKSEKEHLQRQLVQSQKLESIGQLAGGVAHDLNNLLSPILGYSELLLFDPNLNETYRKQVGQIEKAGTGARDLVHQLLAFSRKQTLEFTSININNIIMDYADLLKRTIRENIELKLSLSPDVKQVLADIGQIEQVIMNLVVNAADSMPDGGKLIIETTLETLGEHQLQGELEVASGEYVMISCSDTGYGMDDEICKQIFEPFFSTKGEMGTGLGLATVYGIIKQHRGKILVYSEPGLGTTFKIYLPVSDELISGPKKDIETRAELKGTETILLVEDNEQVMKIAHDILQFLGYNLLTASKGEDAVALMERLEDTVHLLLTDVIMPDMNGRELFTRLSEKRPELKVIYMSGYSDDVIDHHGVLDKGVHFVQKPFSTETIGGKVREVLEH